MNEPLKILITNYWLQSRSGSEVVVRDVALGMLSRGHQPTVYAPYLAAPAEELRSRGVRVIDDLAELVDPPQIIHGHHNIPTVEALARFPVCPAIWVCHDRRAWHDEPPRFQRIYQYIGIGDESCDRILRAGIAPDRITLLRNAVDLARIPPRPEELPDRPRHALAFSKTAGQMPFLEDACRQLGLLFAAIGLGAERLVEYPERELVRYDLVFATARCAIEAMCAGSAVVVCDARGLGEMVTTANFERLRDHNFSWDALSRPVTVKEVIAEVKRFDRQDALAVAQRIRAEAGLENYLATLERLYRDAITAAERSAWPPDDREALLQFMHEWFPWAPDKKWAWQQERSDMIATMERADRTIAEMYRRAAAAERKLERLARPPFFRVRRAIRRMVNLRKR